MIENTRLNILQLSSGHSFGGLETGLVQLASSSEAAAVMNFEFVVAHHGELARQLQAMGCAVHCLGPERLRQLGGVLRARRKLRDLLASRKFDIAICHESWTHVVFGPAVRKSGTALVFAGHDNHVNRHWLSSLAGRIRPDLALANSRFAAEGLARRFPSTPIEIIYNVFPQRGDSSPAARVRVRADLGSSDAIAILCASRLDALKGHSNLFEALAALRDIPRWVCWLAGGSHNPGEDRYLAQLKDQVQRLGIAERIRFLGHRSDMRDLYRGADIYCQPNIEPETFGRSIAEALLANLPVITSAFGGALEMVDKECGILVPAGDVDGLVKALKTLLLDEKLRHGLGIAGPQRVRALCDARTQVLKLQAVLLRTAFSARHSSMSKAS